MSFRDDLQTGTAQISLDIIKAVGSMATYSNRGGAGVTVYVHPEAEEQDLDSTLPGIISNKTKRTFLIPKQISFPPSNGIDIDDKIIFPTSATFDYQVETWEDISGGIGSLFQVNCSRTQARRTK